MKAGRAGQNSTAAAASMASSRIVPDDLPLFDISTHDLYALAHGLIESDADHEFCHRLFKELLQWHEKQGDKKVRKDGKGRGGVENFSASTALLGVLTRQRVGSES